MAKFFKDKPFPTQVRERVLEKANGNPFFIEQLLNSLLDSGAVVQEEDGVWVLTSDIDSISVPDTIQGILLARLDQLPRPARAVLETAAVIGRVFLLKVLKAAIGTVRALEKQIEHLVEQELLEQNLKSPLELEYMFTNSLARDVTYRSLPEARRKVLHEQVAHAIETLDLSAADKAALLAVHYKQTDNREKALQTALETAERARRNYANQDALNLYLQALETLDGDPRANLQTRLMVLESIGDIYALLGELEEEAESDTEKFKAETYFKRARDECTLAWDRARFLRKLGDLSQSTGAYAEAKTWYQLAEGELVSEGGLGLNESQSSAMLVEQINIWLAQARMDRSRGALQEARSILDKALPLLGKVDDPTKASLLFERGEVEREAGLLISASGYLSEAEAIWKAIGATERQALVVSALADAALNKGNLPEALSYFEDAHQLQQRVLDRQGMAATLAGVGRVKLAVGDLPSAARFYTDAMRMSQEIKNRILAAYCMLQLGTIALEYGDLEEAEKFVSEARREFKTMRNWRGSANARLVRARLLRARKDPAHARIVLAQALSLARTMNDPMLEALISLSEAELEEEAGNMVGAAGLSEAVIGMGRTLSDRRLVARAERILGRVRARQGQRAEALALLSSSVAAFQRSGARADAARAALDYAIVSSGATTALELNPRQLVADAVITFQQLRSRRDLQIAHSVAKRLGYDREVATR
jgi:adenylate cyclase